MKVTRIVIAALLAAPLAAFGGAPSAHATAVHAALARAAAESATVTEIRRFTGYGSSDFGLEYYYARTDALRQASFAGFGDCVEVFKLEWPLSAMVIMECSR